MRYQNKQPIDPALVAAIERPSERTHKVSKELQRILSQILQPEWQNQPEFKLVSISSVDVSPDLTLANVYLLVADPLSGEPASIQLQQSLLGFLTKNLKKFRYKLGLSIRLRHIPRIHFLIDPSFANAKKIDALFSAVPKPVS